MTEAIKTEVVVLGAGVGGYSAAFRAADLGKQVTLIEQRETLGGVCLNVGCIPSKALLHSVDFLEQVNAMSANGIETEIKKIEPLKIAAWKDSIVKRLTSGLAFLAKQRKVNVMQGRAEFISPHEIKVRTLDGEKNISFDYAIIAAGSLPVKLPFLPDDPRIIDSTGALKLEKTSGELLILGGGIIGLEMATVYAALGAKITVVEMMSQLIPGADSDLVEPLFKRVKRNYKILLKTKVIKVENKEDGIWVSFENEKGMQEPQRFDQVLVSVGRRPNGALIGAEKAGVSVNEKGFILIDAQMRTNVPHIFAVGDIVSQPMLAHKAAYEGRLASEVIAGSSRKYAAKCIPSVAYTDPEIAWVGATENELKEKNTDYGKGVFPWMACGRALTLGRSEGMTKILFDQKTEKILGAGIVGVHAGDLISELALAIELGATAEQITGTIHPHPTLSETIMMAAEVFEGTATDIKVS